MFKKFLSLGLVLSLVLCMFGCSGSSQTAASTSESVAANTEAPAPAKKKVVWAQGASGNLLVSLAKKYGYFDEVGLEVEEIPLDEGQIQAVITGRVDIASNTGTWEPIRSIVSGNDLAIIGGHMLTGCMPVIAKQDTVWNSPEDFIGKRIADDKSCYALYHQLAENGHNLDTEIEWRTFNHDTDELQAIKNGDIDFATMGTNMMYQLKNTPEIKIVTYCSDVTPNYSCCRMIARESWVKANPDIVKSLDMALIRAKSYLDDHKPECVEMMMKQLDKDREWIEAYMLDEHYRIHPDTLKNIVMDNYKYITMVGGVENPDPNVKLEDRIYNNIYKEALDEAQQRWGSENPKFYEAAQTFYKENNE